MQIRLFIGLLWLVVFPACRRYNTQQPEQDIIAAEERQQKELLVRINRQLVDNDRKDIEAYLEKTGWKMQVTESGLWYMISKTGKGEHAVTGKTAELSYTLSLLDSTICYTSDRLGVKTFRLGEGGVEAGLEEGVLLMQVGDKARFIMPPHLAQGLTGDGICIPGRSIIIYEVELLALK